LGDRNIYKRASSEKEKKKTQQDLLLDESDLASSRAALSSFRTMKRSKKSTVLGRYVGRGTSIMHSHKARGTWNLSGQV
jgi:hypothetical protein